MVAKTTGIDDEKILEEWNNLKEVFGTYPPEIIGQHVERFKEWRHELRTKKPYAYAYGKGLWVPPEILCPEVVDVLSKILVSIWAVQELGEDGNEKRMEYQKFLVRNVKLSGWDPLFSTADIENGDMDIWDVGAHVYVEYLIAQPDFPARIKSVEHDLLRIQRPCAKKNAEPMEAARTNKKKKDKRTQAVTQCYYRDDPAAKSHAILRWQSAIRMQIKLNRMHRVETAKNIVESMRRKKVRQAAEAAKTERKEAPFSVKGPSGPARKHASVYAEKPSFGDQAKRDCQKAKSIESAAEHHMLLKAQESLRLAQAEQRMEALRIASQIQHGDGEARTA